jgi:hypothetical protein
MFIRSTWGGAMPAGMVGSRAMDFYPICPEDKFMAKAAEPPSGTRDFLADDVRRRKAAFDTIARVFEH